MADPTVHTVVQIATSNQRRLRILKIPAKPRFDDCSGSLEYPDVVVVEPSKKDPYERSGLTAMLNMRWEKT